MHCFIYPWYSNYLDKTFWQLVGMNWMPNISWMLNIKPTLSQSHKWIVIGYSRDWFWSQIWCRHCSLINLVDLNIHKWSMIKRKSWRMTNKQSKKLREQLESLSYLASDVDQLKLLVPEVNHSRKHIRNSRPPCCLRADSLFHSSSEEQDNLWETFDSEPPVKTSFINVWKWIWSSLCQLANEHSTNTECRCCKSIRMYDA